METVFRKTRSKQPNAMLVACRLHYILKFWRAIAYEDLIYVLSKYRLIHLYQQNELEVARSTLEENIWPIVENEQTKAGVRAKWFMTGRFKMPQCIDLIVSDYNLLDALVNPKHDEDLSFNMYANFQWDSELKSFWESVLILGTKSRKNGPPPPLYAHVVVKHFWHQDVSHEMAGIDDIIQDSHRWHYVNRQLATMNPQLLSASSLFKDKQSEKKEHVKKVNLQASIQVESQVTPLTELEGAAINHTPQESRSRSIRRIKIKAAASSIPSITSYGKSLA